jgi:nucleoside-diphosphate-sugar epimerase
VKLFVFGPGYSASAAIARLGERGAEVTATARSDERAVELAASGIRPMRFEGAAGDDLIAAVADATHMLVSIPPGEAGDPVLAGSALDAASGLRSIVYLSTVGVYGDHDGGWVDEQTEPRPKSGRSIARLAAEEAWAKRAAEIGKPLAILRLAGIYGPGRNAFASLAAGTARRIVKPGQVFNRIEVDDIATAIVAAFDREAGGIFNVTDDEPAPPQDIVAYAAELMGIDPPPQTPFATADLSPMARSFYGENKRVRNARLKDGLAVELRFPSYREGLTALWQAGEGRRPATT